MREVILVVLAFAGVVASFVVAAYLQRRKKATAATFAPLFIFLPVALVCLGQIQPLTALDAAFIAGFALVLCGVTWLYQKGV